MGIDPDDVTIKYQKTTDFGQVAALSRLMDKERAQPEDMVIAKIERDVNANCLFFGHRIVIPQVLQHRVLTMLHEGHPGSTRMKVLARSYVYWHNIDQDIVDLVGRCTRCQESAKNSVKNELSSWPKTTSPWQRIHIDFAGPLKGKMFLVVVDAFSKWPEIIEMTSATTEATILQLRKIFAQFGYPNPLISDNGTQFTAAVFQEFCEKHNIQHVRSPPFHSQSNGQAERFVDTFKRALKKMRVEGAVGETLQTFLFTYRRTPCPFAPNQLSPAENFIGRPLRSTLASLNTFEDNTTGEKDVNMEEQCRKKHCALEVIDGTWIRHANQLRLRAQSEEAGNVTAETDLWQMFDLPKDTNTKEKSTPQHHETQPVMSAEEEQVTTPVQGDEYFAVPAEREKNNNPTPIITEETREEQQLIPGNQPVASPSTTCLRSSRIPRPTPRLIIDPRKQTYV
ncbi:uncharacterized protein K02A2.6-like [Daphnia carinata]|uniref:uncharacterized protein K02A2.6-like n=1 Tax=Daphnia carinata TaxID=120202 RepID=UPI002869658A|nr:uncharacterized protein K02A2.6-like [Daphnia carinata]